MGCLLMSSAVLFLFCTFLQRPTEATLVASSKVNICGREQLDVEPKQLNGEKCSKKFVVALTVENGKACFSYSLQAYLKFLYKLERFWCNLCPHPIC